MKNVKRNKKKNLLKIHEFHLLQETLIFIVHFFCIFYLILHQTIDESPILVLKMEAKKKNLI